jgi:N,N'-diacetyllegionaminate synthase
MSAMKRTPVAVTIIAEAGVNHNGDIRLAHGLVDAAADAGADLVKFQTFSAARLVTAAARKADYQLATTDRAESQQEMIRRLELTPQMHEELIAHCERRGIRFFSSAFDLESIDLLARLGLDRFKIPSGEITNLPYLRHVGRQRLPVILSTGMATLAEVEAAMDVLVTSGVQRESITVLHCNTEYPTPMTDVNLRAMQSMQRALGVPVGYSDHTAGIEVAVAAVALGATVIEKHLTLDRTLPGPDHRASLEPAQFGAMVAAIRNIERALGDDLKQPSPSEQKNIAVARKSIVAARPIRKGEVLTEAHLAAKRPGTGLSPMLWDELIGRTASRDFAADEPLEW